MDVRLSKEEIKIIDNIKIGCEELIKLILSDRLKSPEKYAKLSSHTKQKPVVRLSAIFEVLRIITKNKEKTFRPIDIRKELPYNYKDIRYSALSDIINSLVKMEFIIKASDFSIKKHRGHPFKSEDESIDNTDIPGLKSYYTISPLLESIRNILDKQEVNESIYNHLLATGLLLKLYEKTKLSEITTFKTKYVKSALNTRKMVKLPESETKTESQFLEYFKKKSEIYNKMSEDEVLKYAKEWAKNFIIKHKPIEFKSIFQLGMICYNMISSNIKLSY
jgi:hypothetical protein